MSVKTTYNPKEDISVAYLEIHMQLYCNTQHSIHLLTLKG